MPLVRRAQQQRGRVDGAAGDDDDVGAVASRATPSRSTTTPVTVAPERVGLEPLDLRVASRSVTFACSSAGRTAQTWASALPRPGTGSRRACEQRMQRLFCGFGSSSITPTGRWNGLRPARCEVVVQALDPRLVRDRRVRVRAGAPRLGRVLAAPAVHVVEPLGLRRSTARGRRRRSARRARCRRGGGPRRSRVSRRRKRIAP